MKTKLFAAMAVLVAAAMTGCSDAEEEWENVSLELEELKS